MKKLLLIAGLITTTAVFSQSNEAGTIHTNIGISLDGTFWSFSHKESYISIAGAEFDYKIKSGLVLNLTLKQ